MRPAADGARDGHIGLCPGAAGPPEQRRVRRSPYPCSCGDDVPWDVAARAVGEGQTDLVTRRICQTAPKLALPSNARYSGSIT
ncbi:hypothetical protein GCM10010279_68180 [Streptomyces mutabilis]|nr:hypothetical protein GCM10010279_68180 [Streptomyces mutabilis]